MKTKIEIKSILGNVLFTYKAENATIKDAVEKAVKEKVSLDYASLVGASLDRASLDGARLDGARLNGARLDRASLDYASLVGASLDGASLDGASLVGASLDGASLDGAINKEAAYLPIFCRWSYSILGNKIQIGCEERTIEQWDEFFASEEVLSTQRNTDDFKQIQAVYEACKAYLTFLNK